MGLPLLCFGFFFLTLDAAVTAGPVFLKPRPSAVSDGGSGGCGRLVGAGAVCGCVALTFLSLWPQ